MKGCIVSMLLCITVSVLDQVIKIFVPIRHFDWADIPFDIVGAVFGIGLVMIITMIVERS